LSNGRPGVYIDLAPFYGAKVQGPKALEAIKASTCEWRVLIDQDDFDKIPSKPIAFSISDRTRIAFRSDTLISEIAEPRQGLATANNERYLRFWSEIGKSHFSNPLNALSENSKKRWFPYQKGGAFRKWYGNHELVVDWKHDGSALKADPKSVIRNPTYYLKEGMTWTSLTVSSFNGRYCPEGFVFDSKGPVLFAKQGQPLLKIMAFLNSIVSATFLRVLAPTMDFSQGPLGNVPVRSVVTKETESDVIRIQRLMALAKSDWDAYETSWDFTSQKLLSSEHRAGTLAATYDNLCDHWEAMTSEMRILEEENNRLFIDAYCLQEDLKPEVPIKEIALTCNPAYRYGVKINEEERRSRLRTDSMAEFISYAVGCMFGRYSLNKEGLILANQGETLENYLKLVNSPSFEPDDDNVIPLIDLELEKGKQDDWFEDDISERFKAFLKVTFGTDNYDENLRFIEDAIGKDIKKFFLKDFYTDHVKRYKKRPIYWLFSSPKGSFNALIYMHRYRSDTVSVVLNDYLREFSVKLEAKKESYEQTSISANAEPADKTKALKAIEKINKVLEEVKEYERDILYPLASQNVEIDLDDGVKHNYPLFGKALKKITGLS
jgi:hypothetical protein